MGEWLKKQQWLWEADASMIAQTDDFGVLFGMVEMMEEVSGRRDILHLMLVCHLSDFR